MTIQMIPSPNKQFIKQQQAMLSRQIKTHKPKYRVSHRDSHFENDPIESQSTRNPQHIRVVQSHLVYVIGLKPAICNEDTLVGKDFFGKYGKVNKVVINKRGSSNRKHYRDVSYAAHITYEDKVSASLAVISLFEFKYHENIIRSCYGYTKYCENFFYGRDCYKNDCVYLHHFQSDQEIIAGEGCEKQTEKQNFQKQLKLALKIIYQNRKQIIQNCREQKQSSAQFPEAYESMKALIAHGYLTEEEYEKQWQMEDTLKCYTESTETSPMKQGESESDSQKQSTAEELQQSQIEHEPQPQRQQLVQPQKPQKNQYEQSGKAAIGSQQIEQMISKSILRIVSNKTRHTKSKFQFAGSTSTDSHAFRQFFQKELLFKI